MPSTLLVAVQADGAVRLFSPSGELVLSFSAGTVAAAALEVISYLLNTRFHLSILPQWISTCTFEAFTTAGDKDIVQRALLERRKSIKDCQCFFTCPQIRSF